MVQHIDERKITESASSGSLSICLPRWWARSHDLRGGSIVVVGLDGDGRLLIEPKKRKPHQIPKMRGKYESERDH